MAAAFGSGVMYSLVSGMGGPDVVPAALTSGVFFALVQGGLFKVIAWLEVIMSSMISSRITTHQLKRMYKNRESLDTAK